MTTVAVTMPIATSGVVLASVRLVLFMVWTAIVPTAIALLKVCGFKTASIRVTYYRGLCLIFGLDVVVHGQISQDRPLLIASNHISYLDIMAFGSIAELEFVSRADLANWPIVGNLARLGDTVFVDRRRTQTTAARDDMTEHLTDHRSLIFFPEATSGDGNHLLPFKSALFTVAESMANGKTITVQPAAIAYTRLNGLPLGYGWRFFCAWYGDMTLVSHMWRFLQLGQTTVEIVLLEPIASAGEMDRKTLASASEQASRAGFNQLMSGRIAF